MTDKITNLPLLYNNSVEILLKYGNKMYFNAPKNNLDNELFKKIVFSDALKHNNIKVNNDINKKITCEGKQILVGAIRTVYDNWVIKLKCNKCNLIIPIDMDFYSTINNDELNDQSECCGDNNICNLCNFCYNGEENLNLVNIRSDIGNYNDWVHIFTIKNNYDIDFYCNLNKNSSYYKLFASNSYLDIMNGYEFGFEIYKTIEEIIKNYSL